MKSGVRDKHLLNLPLYPTQAGGKFWCRVPCGELRTHSTFRAAHRVNTTQSEPANEVNWEGQPSFFCDGALVLPDDEHPVLLRDCRRSILFDYKGLGVPNIVLQIILSRATSVGLCRGSQVPH